VHGIDDIIILAHAEIVVRAPDGDFPLTILEPGGGLWETALVTVKVDEDPVASFAVNGAKGVFEGFEMLHGALNSLRLTMLNWGTGGLVRAPI
jgi:hypothetical protein